MVRVLIADDEPLIRAGIRMVLSHADDVEVVAEANNGREAIDLASKHMIDVVLLDIRMPVLDGLFAAEEIARRSPTTKILMLTTFSEDDYVARALKAGAAGFLLKSTAPEELIRAVRISEKDEAILSPVITRRLIDRFLKQDDSRAHQARMKIESLSGREREVLVMVGEGLSNAEIAKQMFVSEGTVKATVSRVLTKLDCTNRVQAAILAHEGGTSHRSGSLDGNRKSVISRVWRTS